MAWIGLLAVLGFTGALVLLHAANSREMPAHMSGFVHTSLAPLWVMSLAFFALGAIALGVELRRRLRTHPFRHAGVTMIWLAAAGALVLAACPVDADPYNRTTLGLLHEDVAPPTFLFTAAAMLALAPAFYAARWRRYAVLSFLCGFLALAFAIAYVVATLSGDPSAGILQRFLVGFIVTWMALVAAGLLRRAKPDPEPAPASQKPAPRPRSTCAL